MKSKYKCPEGHIFEFNDGDDSDECILYGCMQFASCALCSSATRDAHYFVFDTGDCYDKFCTLKKVEK